MKFAFIQEDIVVKIEEVASIEELLPMDKSYQNLIELSGFTPEPQIGWIFRDNQFIRPSDISVSNRSMKITKLALLNRFTVNELLIYEQALTVSLGLKVLDKKLFAASYIDLSRPDTISGIQMLVGAGVLSPIRASEILTVQPSEIELHKE